MRKTVLILTATAILAACGGGQGTTVLPANDATPPEQNAADEDWAPAQEAEHVTMGKVVAVRFADLSFDATLPIGRVLVRNGQQVRRGQVLAQLDLFQLRNAVEQAQRSVEQAQLQTEQARLQMQDVIISQGYDPDREADIPETVRHNADVKSGYALSKSLSASAQTQLEAARHALGRGVLTAPFDGVVANLSVQAHQLAQPGQPVCRVIATGSMAVEFRVMEADLRQYKLGTVVNVIPVADKTLCYQATVEEINPVVDQQGAVTLRAGLSSTQGLFDGMNVEVILGSL